jgi:prepilin peptidase CpaA
VGFLLSGNREPLPAFAWAAVFLFLVVEEDLRVRRIPNWLTGSALVVAIGLATWTDGWSGGVTALLGAGLALAVLFPMFLLRGIGAGDVKARMVLGALWGPVHLFGSLLWILVAGGVLAIAIGAIHGLLAEIVRRWALALSVLLTTQRWIYSPQGPGSTEPVGVPFGLAIALGAMAYQYGGIPWL